MSNNYDIDRFVKMHEKYYETALKEIKEGKKQSHWIWYIFPQLKDLGYSDTAKYYGMSGTQEAEEYWNNDYLRNHMLEICGELLKLNDTADNIMGWPDNMKLRSSMTLFNEAIPEEEIFKRVLDKFYNGELDPMTIELLNRIMNR